MEELDRRDREIAALQERLSRLSEASLRINESLDFDVVLQGVLDSARSLTGARYGVMTLLDDAGSVQDFLSSGLTAEESAQLWLMPEGLRIFQALTNISEPVRIPDLAAHMRSLGFRRFHHSPAGGGLLLPGLAHVPPGRPGGPLIRGVQGGWQGGGSTKPTRRPW